MNKDILTETGCIYVIHNIITNKYYVGQTRLRNPIIRWKDHYDEAFLKNNQYHLYASMRKYGIEKFQFQIIEDAILIEELNDKEKYYINLYDSYNNGYNNTAGGQDDSWHTKLTKIQVLEIINLIQENILSFNDIAKKYNINPSTVSDINRGDTWHFEEFTYPIVNKNNKKYFTEQEIQDIYSKLRQGISATAIGAIYQVSRVTINNINNGKIYIHNDVEYPIYKPINSAKRLEVNQIQDVINELLNTSLSYTQIGEKLGIGRKTVSNIDQGKGYINIIKQLGYTTFPIRRK